MMTLRSQGRKALIIDDDVRNIFSLTSALETHGMQVSFAEDGRDGIEKLQCDRRASTSFSSTS